jgi:hypothetical protein
MALGMTRREMLERIGSREYVEWQAFYAVRPFGDTIIHRMLAGLLCMGYNINRGKRPARKESDFYPFEEYRTRREVSQEELKGYLEVWAVEHNARVKADQKKKTERNRRRKK